MIRKITRYPVREKAEKSIKKDQGKEAQKIVLNAGCRCALKFCRFLKVADAAVVVGERVETLYSKPMFTINVYA